jgi:MoxR-like ATPase
VSQLSIEETASLCRQVLDRVSLAVVGVRDELGLVLAGILAGGHVLLEDMPGLGKTLTARSFAQALGIGFQRLQFTPDLLPADVTGSYVFNQRDFVFEFIPGPIFTNLLLADEINRTPPRTQSALLEAMQERQVTVEGKTSRLEAPFHVLATANPIEYEGTYQLPEAQLDRFLLRVSFGYPDHDDETEILSRRISRRHEEQTLDPVTDEAGLLAMQAAVETIEVEHDVLDYIVTIVAATRTHPQVLVGASPRGALAIMLCARARAGLIGRDFVIPDDVKAVAPAALGHRMTLRSESYLHGATGEAVIGDLLAAVPVPPTVTSPRFDPIS